MCMAHHSALLLRTHSHSHLCPSNLSLRPSMLLLLLLLLLLPLLLPTSLCAAARPSPHLGLFSAEVFKHALRHNAAHSNLHGGQACVLPWFGDISNL